MGEERQQISFEIPSEFDVETINMPQNYTMFVNELRRFAFGSEPDNSIAATSSHHNNHHHNHGMSDEEYARFVSDMWIGIVLTMLMVFIVFALCFWYMYHKFQEWKQSYDARSQMRHSAGGTPNMDLETLPNYTLVSGLPTYDDALEQLRMNSSTNHLLINHQTLMKLFGSVKDKSSATVSITAEKEEQQRTECPAPSYEDAMHRVNGTSPTQTVAFTVLGDRLFDQANTLQSVENGSPTTTISTNIPISNVASDRPMHRFICTVVPPTQTTPLQPQPLPPPIGTKSMDSCYFNADDDEDDDPMTVHTNSAAAVLMAHSPGTRSNHLIDFGSCHQSNLNTRPEMTWIHRSALSLSKSFDNDPSLATVHQHHRASLY